MKKKRFILAVGYPWASDLTDEGMEATAITIKSNSDGSGERLILRGLGRKWGGWKKFKLVLEEV